MPGAPTIVATLSLEKGETLYLASLKGAMVELGTNPPGAMGKPPRPSTVKLLTPPLKRTAQSGRS